MPKPHEARKVETDPRPTPSEIPPSRRDRLERVIERVRDDANDRPEDYLRATEVPGGGE
ncbi:MAG: hypothetical protein AAGA48_34990 [Myxococcota bacterium]